MRKKWNKKKTGKRQNLKFVSSVVLIILAVMLVFSTCEINRQVNAQEMRGIWISYVDYKKLGLYNESEEVFVRNAEVFFDKAKDYSINTVFFHVRAFRDAAYDSDYFPMSVYIWDRTDPIGYDPLEIMIELAHERGMELHAWLNPYRNSSFELPVLDPSSDESTGDILLCVREILLEYDVDGIHFDDYFYEEDSSVAEDEKKVYVNEMIKSVYAEVKKLDSDILFGISPAGNISYCELIGADVKTWLSEEGYVDYIVPQIYWTDNHSATWRENMFSDTLNEWKSINELNVPMYIGLALYRAGTIVPEDPGWGKADDNIAAQIKYLREQECDGLVLFSASDMFRNSAENELENYKQEVEEK